LEKSIGFKQWYEAYKKRSEVEAQRSWSAAKLKRSEVEAQRSWSAAKLNRQRNKSAAKLLQSILFGLPHKGLYRSS
jgi:hypothetical protein